VAFGPVEDAFDITRDIDNFLEPDWTVDDLVRDNQGRALGLCAISSARIEADVTGLDGSCVTRKPSIVV
jgi:hypothetical protein